MDYYDARDECCASSMLDFAIPNGRAMLVNDRRVSVSLPAGVISDVGLDEIRRVIIEVGAGFYWDQRAEAAKWYDLANDVSTLGDQWQTSEGNYTRRLSKLAHKTQGLKVSGEVLSQVGNIAREHSVGVDLRVAVTRDLNQAPHKFAYEGSCWWNPEEHQDSRCTLKTNGGFGLRSFRYQTVTGRAWVLPLRRDPVRPTFETLEPDAYLVFNGYEDLHLSTAARVMGKFTGWPYKRVAVDIEPVYVNSGTGFVIAPKDTIESFGMIEMELHQHSDLYAIEKQERAS